MRDTLIMKSLLLFSLFSFTTLMVSAQAKTDTTQKAQIVEAACGQCKFDLKSKGCDLAVRINGKAYFVDGTAIDDHGDAHADDGFCNAIRKAEVKGEVVNGRFKATYFKLLPKEEPRKE